MQQDISLSVPNAEQELAALTDKATGLGRETVEIGAFLHDLDSECRAQTQTLDAVRRGSVEMTQATDRMLDAVQRMARMADGALENVTRSTSTIAANGEASQSLAQWVRSVHAGGSDVETMLRAVQTANAQIADIASQVTLLAVNAKIEAARAGAAGAGFSIVAAEINALSQKTSAAAQTVTDTVGQLSRWVAELTHGAQRTVASAEQVLERSAMADTALGDIEAGMKTLQSDAHGLTEEADRARSVSQALAPQVDGIAGFLTRVAGGIDEASNRCDSLVDTSEGILQHAVALGGNGADGPMITLVQDLAGQIAQRFEEAIAQNRISGDALFDDKYRPVAGSNPQQVLTAFTRLTDELLPPIQEPVLMQDDRVVFCAAVDRNGYLPTHNRKFSQPQGDDPVWNAANSRNRRIFDDRVGLKAGRNQKPFLLQVYRRDMGGGNFVMMKDLSAPIRVRGRHWGGLRLAYRF